MSEQDISESPDIRFVGVSKWFGDVVAVDKIDLSVERGAELRDAGHLWGLTTGGNRDGRFWEIWNPGRDHFPKQSRRIANL